MPGYGRWRAISLANRDPNEDCYACEASIGLEMCENISSRDTFNHTFVSFAGFFVGHICVANLSAADDKKTSGVVAGV